MMNTNRIWLKTTIIIAILLFISALIYAIFLYMDLNDKRTAGFNETVNELINQTTIEEITHIEQFNGAEAYHVVYGINEEDTEQIIFYPLEGKEKTLTTIDAEETITEEEMKSIWTSSCSDCKFIDMTPALMDEDILWELVYYDEQNRYVFDYRSIHDGSEVEKIGYVRKFK